MQKQLLTDHTRIKTLLSIIRKLPKYNKINAALTLIPLQGFTETSLLGTIAYNKFQNLIGFGGISYTILIFCRRTTAGEWGSYY